LAKQALELHENQTFAAAFQCNAGDAMVREETKRCQIW
jgi:predicted metalloendopeptidase